jgi:hypothetical protein
MTISKWTAIGSLLGVLVLGVAIGRFATPTKTLERDRIVTVDRDTELTWHAYVGRSETKVETKTAWKTVTKWGKDGSVIQTVAAVQDKTEDTKTETAENDGKVKETIKYRDVEKIKIVESPRPDWLLSGQVGSRFDGWQPVYGATVARRIAGPVFLSAWGQASGLTRDGAAAGLGVSLLF